MLLVVVLTVFAGTHQNRDGQTVNNFLNLNTLVQVLTDTSFFAIMAVGVTVVIVSGGIDLSVGSIYALSGVTMALVLKSSDGGAGSVAVGLTVCLSIGIACGLLNGLMVSRLKVHPFIITLGTMWIYRGIAFVSSKAVSIGVPGELTAVVKADPLGKQIYVVPALVMLAVALAGALFLGRTVAGRHIFAVGGNAQASTYSGLRIDRILVGVFTVSGLCAGLAAFVGASYFGSANCIDANGYELYVIASAVVGGASLTGGKGSAISAMLGALLIVLIRQSIRTLHLDQNYEWIIIGIAIILAVVLDRWSAQLAQRKLVDTRDAAIGGSG